MLVNSIDFSKLDPIDKKLCGTLIKTIVMSSNSKRSIPWRSYFIELLVVFIGVMSAFLLSNWGENRRDQTLEENYLMSIYSDLEEDYLSLDENISTMTEHLRILDKFLFEKGQGWSEDSTSVVIANSLALIKFSGKSSTYESMKYSGHLSLIDEFELRNQIVDYYESYSVTDLLEETYTFWITQSLSPFYVENFDMFSFEFIRPEDVEEVPFQNRMFGYRVLLQQNLNAYRDLRDSNVQLHELLREHMEIE